MWQDWIISQAFGMLILILQGDSELKKKWRKAIVKVCKLGIAAFPEDFPAVAPSVKP
jgi:hypothetical protein